MNYRVELFQDIDENFDYFNQMFEMFKEHMSYLHKISDDDFSYWCDNIVKAKNLGLICLFDDDLLRAFIEYTIKDDHVNLCEIQIDKACQGDKKTFRILFGQFLSIIKSMEISQIICQINPQNDKSKEVFNHLGFESIGNNRYMTTIDKFNGK